MAALHHPGRLGHLHLESVNRQHRHDPVAVGTSDQYIELTFTANSVQNGAQMSELEVFG